MRILFVTQIIPYPAHGGVLQRGFNILRELGRAHEVHLLAFHHPNELPHGEPLARSREVLGKFCAKLEYFSLWPKRSPAHTLAAFAAGAVYPKPFSVLAHRSGALGARISQICSSNPPDIVHLDTIALAPYAKQCGSVPVVLCHHNIESQLMERRADHEVGRLRQAYVRAQTRRLISYESQQSARFPLNITVSGPDAETLKRLSPTVRTAVVPNGVDTEYFKPIRGQETPTLIYTGGMNMFANRDAVEWFLDNAWARIKAAVPEARFVAIGQKPSPKVLEAASRDSSVEAPGFVDDVRPWVARAAVYVVPLRVGGGTRLKVLDAMAQGKAIVSTTLGAEGIEAEAGKHFVVADEPEAFADAAIRLLKDQVTARRLGDAARERVEQRYAWPILGERLAQHYAQVIEEARR